MNILIADDLTIYRATLKLCIQNQWPSAVIHEASSMNEVVEDTFAVNYDLLILDIEMPGTEKLEGYVKKAVQYTKVIIFSDYDKGAQRVKSLIEIGADAFLSKTAKHEEVISTLQFVLS